MYAKFKAETLVERVFNCSQDNIASTVLIAPTKHIVANLEAHLQNPQPFGSWFTGVSGFLDNDVFVTILNNVRYAPGMADCIYFLQFANVQNILYTGAIGGLGADMSIGDIILVTDVERGDGASKYWVPFYEPAVANSDLVNRVRPFLTEACEVFGSKVHEGRIFTTDSLAAETEPFLASLQAGNILGIEMETSALYVVAQKFGMRAVAAHVVSDLPLQEKTLFNNFTQQEKERRASAHSITVDALTGAIKALVSESNRRD